MVGKDPESKSMKKTSFLLICLMSFSTVAFAEKVSSISEFGITWTFDRPYESGHFANGDSWVVGPVSVINIDPPSVNKDGRVMNGSMLNVSSRLKARQGFDSGKGSPAPYDASLNVALGVSADKPLALPAGSSLVSSVSVEKEGSRPEVKVASVLTVLDKQVLEGSFRPPYAGTDKTVRYNVNQLNRQKLLKLKPAGKPPEIAIAERYFERPWIDYMGWNPGTYVHPLDNMPMYSREMCQEVSEASLVLLLDMDEAKKETLLIRLVQLGMDNYGLVQDGGPGFDIWKPGGGMSNGRKWPILFAGLMLGDDAMMKAQYPTGEDGNTYYGPCWTGATVCWGMYHTFSPKQDHEEKPPSEWKFDGRGKPGDPGAGHDSDSRSDSYRRGCTSSTWVGEALAAQLLKMDKAWNHPAFFDYMDRWMYEDDAKFRLAVWQASGAVGVFKTDSFVQGTSRSPFIDAMWAAYRPTPPRPIDGWEKPH